MLEIVHRDWNLKPIFTQKWAPADRNWDPQPPTADNSHPAFRVTLHSLPVSMLLSFWIQHPGSMIVYWRWQNRRRIFTAVHMGLRVRSHVYCAALCCVLQELRSNLHSAECHSTAWRFYHSTFEWTYLDWVKWVLCFCNHFHAECTRVVVKV